MWAWNTVCPAASPQFTPTLKPCGLKLLLQYILDLPDESKGIYVLFGCHLP